MRKPADRDQPAGDERLAAVYREASGQAVAHLIRVFGDIDVAEDAVQEAFADAMRVWPVEGMPANPAAWILTASRNRATDRLRRASLGRALLVEVAERRAQESAQAEPNQASLDEDSLRLIFICCHPALAQASQVALTLRLFAGLSTVDIARAFLVEEATMAQRLVRAKRKIKSAHIPFRIPDAEERPQRLSPALSVAYLTFNAGGGRTAEQHPLRQDFCAEGLRLARRIHDLIPEERESAGLLALLLFSAARNPARFADDGSLVLLRDQDRARWDRGLVAEGLRVLQAISVDRPAGAYEIQASIQAVHCLAPSAEDTDWALIVRHYDALLRCTKSPVVALNRAIAVAEVQGPEAALRLLGELEMENYYLYHSTRADLLRRSKRTAAAMAAYERARTLAPTAAEQAFLEERIQALRED